jgi:DUF4097 and DUF4098 domain-containing protein YvlB
MRIPIALTALLVLVSAAGADDRAAERREAERAVLAVEREAAAVARDAARAAAEAQRVVLRHAGRVRGTARTETTVVAPRHARLELESLGGEIVVSGWDRNTVRVVADHPPGARVTVTVQPAAVVVKARGQVRVPEPEPARGARVRTVTVPVRVDYRLSVPRGMSLRLTGVDSEIRVEDVRGDVNARTVNGPVRVRGGRGAVRVGAINGDVEVADVLGLVEASSMNERVLLRDVEGRVRAETVRGDLDLARVLSQAVEASTVSGNLRYEGSISPGGAYRFESHSGDVVVVMPARPDAAVKVETYEGSFQSSFPVPAGRPHLGREFEFLLGDGRAEVELASFSGAIRLVREGELPAPPAPPAKSRKAAPAAPATPAAPAAPAAPRK